MVPHSDRRDARQSGHGDVAPQQSVPHGLWFGDGGPPVAQKLPPVQAAPSPHLQVPVAASQYSPRLQQALPQHGPFGQRLHTGRAVARRAAAAATAAADSAGTATAAAAGRAATAHVTAARQAVPSAPGERQQKYERKPHASL